MHKIEITSIENIPWAQRLIINFYLLRDCFNPSIGGWDYILADCGYKGLCDTEWINILPNTQHPLHSTIIRYAGNYTFVWDYGGVEGINPANFNSNHSYVIQLVLADRTCGFIDPCADASYVTQYGLEPEGAVGTDGDPGNINNNCGSGYTLRADSNGCLFCEAIPYNSGSGAPDISEPSETESGWDISEPSHATRPSEPSEPDPPISGITEASQASQIEEIEPGHTADGPLIAPLTAGPMGPGGPPTSDVIGSPASSPLPMGYNYALGGDIPFVEGSFGPNANIQGTLSRTSFGGTSSKVSPIIRLNARVPIIAKKLISNANAALNQKQKAAFLNINTNQVRSQSKISAPNDVKKQTKPQPTIVIVDNVAYIKQKDSASNGTSSNVQPIKDLVKIPRQYTSSTDNRVIKVGGQQRQFVDNEVKSLVSPGSRLLNLILEKVKSNVFNLDASSSFSSSFDFQVKTDSQTRSGDTHYFESYVRSIGRGSYRLMLSVFLKSGNNVYHVASSSDITRSGTIRIAQQIAINVPPGNAYVIAVVYDAEGKVVAVKPSPIKVLDSFTKRGGIYSTSSIVPAKFNNTIEELISSNSSITFPIGEPNNYVGLYCNILPGANDLITLASMVKPITTNVEHGIKIIDDSNVVISNSFGKLNINGISPTGNYTAASYVKISRAIINDCSIIVSSNSVKSNIVTVNVGRDIALAPFAVISNSFNSLTNILTVLIDMPFVSTDFIAYVSGVANYAPPIVRGATTFATNSQGRGVFSITNYPNSWITIALKYPSDVPIDKRKVYTFKGSGL